mmetsp:Transcript_92485/g.146235  ORF Transcript_92485/g.146235 Transcript_92485/m.146235 type:complete len:249 (-) Transcript_92485:77-823(-)
MVSSMDGSDTRIGWKRRSKALSFSMCARYSSNDVTPMHCTSPRARIGLMMFEASTTLSPFPARPVPTSVCNSSMKRIVSPLASTTSWSTSLNLFSNSPLALAPARIDAMSSCKMRFFIKTSGTSSATIFCAKPSTTAVLPTPGSPIRTGLFFCRRAKICVMRSSSDALPTSGSKAPSAAACVKSLVHLESKDDAFLLGAAEVTRAARGAEEMRSAAVLVLTMTGLLERSESFLLDTNRWSGAAESCNE